MTDSTAARVDRGDAVNLAQNWLKCEVPLTDIGIRNLCRAVLRMDQALGDAPSREAVLACARMVRGRLAGREEASPLWLEINKIANMLERHADTLASGRQDKEGA